jgi:hypothetical protein
LQKSNFSIALTSSMLLSKTYDDLQLIRAVFKKTIIIIISKIVPKKG